MEIQYVGEHLLPGKVGHFFIALSFAASLVAMISYWFASNTKDQVASWTNIGRQAFKIHTYAVFGIGATLFYIIFNHYFEYHYAWQHSNKELPFRYVFSCFWEGQEGSFWLWMFWQSILGVVLIRLAKDWENPVMTVFSSVQVFLASMLLGVVVFNYKIGSNPFVLLREAPDMANMPFLKIPTYLEKLDGRGLNPLLQNYWMTIHPPTLFLGFASTLIPFCYAIAALWKKRFEEWQKPTLPWTFFGIMILGTGILMGGAWAYEALSFGGFWAWDPVENASLVPWLTFVGAGHVMLINRHKGSSLFTAFLLTSITFILILYSTFLTRSGILGDSSVHAFTDLGMSGQLLIYLLVYIFLSIFLLVKNYKNIPGQGQEDELWSREFWMFMGSLVLLVAAFQIIFTTSIPVINKVFGLDLAPPTDAVKHYNSWQIPFAIIVALLIAIGQYFKYRKTDIKEFAKKIVISFSFALIITVIGAIGLQITNFFLVFLFFASVFSVAANFEYYLRIFKGKAGKAGASVAHIGFGLILSGALISMSKQQIISRDTSGQDLTGLEKDLSSKENILLTQGDTVQMGDYYVTYSNRIKEGVNIFYEMDYFKKAEDGTYKKEFTLKPLIQTNPRMGNIAEPDTKHHLHKDIYTHITYAVLDKDKSETNNDFRETLKAGLQPGDTIFASQAILLFEGINKEVDKDAAKLQSSDIALGARFKILTLKDEPRYAEPLYVIRGNYMIPLDAELSDLGIKLRFNKLNTENGAVDIVLSEQYEKPKDFIVMKAIVFPGINILWIGCFIMILGSVLAIIHRIRIAGKS